MRAWFWSSSFFPKLTKFALSCCDAHFQFWISSGWLTVFYATSKVVEDGNFLFWYVIYVDDCILIFFTYILRGGSRAAATSKMKYFVIIVNGWKPLTIITKRSILDVAAALDPPLILMIKTHPLCFRDVIL